MHINKWFFNINIILKWAYIYKAIMEEQSKYRSTNPSFIIDSFGHFPAHYGLEARASSSIEVRKKLCIDWTSKERNNRECNK